MSFIISNPNSPQQRVATPTIVAQTTPPTTGPQLLQFDLGTVWVDSSSNVVYVLTSISGGVGTWVNTIPASGGSFSDLTVSPGPTSITGEFRVNGDVNEADVIRLEENGGASGTITIESVQGTSANSIYIKSVSGGINVETVAAGQDIQLNADLGSIALAAGEDAAQAVFISAGGGTSATMQMINLTGTADASTIANSSLYLASTSGGVGINAGENFNILGSSSSTVEVSVGDLTLKTDTGAIKFNSAGGIDWQITGDVDLDVTGAISLDSTLASNFTVTGAAADLTLSSAGGSVNVTATEAAADAIFVNASAGGVEIEAAGVVLISSTDTSGADIAIEANAAGGGVLIEATGTGGSVTIAPAATLEMAHTATVATIDLGNITPTVARTTTINGGAVSTAIADTLSLAVGGVSTSASASKVVNIATGANLLGTQTVNIATGTAASGTKTVNVGNVDSLTAVNAYGVVGINNSTATGSTTIGTTATGGAVNIKSAGVITVQSADTTGSDILITATGAGGGVVATTGSGNFNINATGTGGTTIGSVATGGAVALNSATAITSLAANVNLNNSGTGATTIGSATGGTIILESNTAAANAIQINAHAATGGVLITAGTGATAGNVSITPATLAGTAGPSATVSSTLNARVGNVTYAGYTQAAAATLTITLTNSFITATSVIFASMTDVSANTTAMTLSKINPGSGSAVFTFTNNGSQAVNGNLQFNFWILS